MATNATDADFDVEVIERSYEVPVLVDFWAEWCGPCRMLGPVLEQIAAGAEGRFELVKVDTEQAPKAAGRYGIRSIPAVKLFVGGKVKAEFVGALPGGAITKFLDQHLPTEADARLAEGREHLARGAEGEARAAFEAALALDADLAAAHLALAELALAKGDAAQVEAHTEAIHPSADEYERGQFVAKALVFWREREAIGGTEKAQARVDADGGDLDAWYGLGCCHAAAQRWPEALEALLQGVMRKNKYRDAAAHKAMLVVFKLLGHHSDLTDTYQRKLQIYT